LNVTWTITWCVVLPTALLTTPSRAIAGERQIRPFVGTTFEGATTFIDSENAVGKAHALVGVNAVWLREIFGVEVDLAHANRFFQAGDRRLVLDSRVTTLMGNVVVAAPARKTQYGLRPYLAGGAGIMWVHIGYAFGVFQAAETMGAVDVGGGVQGFLTNRIGVGWDVRRLNGISKTSEPGITTSGRVQLSFWRASMALVIRY
jgi:hypothetical protein